MVMVALAGALRVRFRRGGTNRAAASRAVTGGERGADG